MQRMQPVFGFALVLLSQTGCCCCVTIPVGPQPGEGGDFRMEPLVPPDSDLDREPDPEGTASSADAVPIDGSSSTEVESDPATD